MLLRPHFEGQENPMQDIEQELARLEPLARQLEPDLRQRTIHNQQVMD